MQKQTVQQMQGAVELLRDAVQVGTEKIGAAHQEIADVPYRILRRVPVVSGPAGTVEHMQTGITQWAYTSVAAIAWLVAAAAKRLLQTVETERQ
jgi:hypothetical protein